MRRSPALCVLLLALLSAGCGGDEAPTTTAPTPGPESDTTELTAAELGSLERAERRVERYCASWITSLPRGSRPPAGLRRRAYEGADRVIALAAAKPRAPIGRSSEVRLRAGDIAESIEGVNCDPALEAYLEQGIAEAVTGQAGETGG